MAQDTQESVHDVYQAVGEISEGARNQADETTDANTNVVRIGEQIEYISDKVNSLTDYAGRMAEAEKASEDHEGIEQLQREHQGICPAGSGTD